MTSEVCMQETRKGSKVKNRNENFPTCMFNRLSYLALWLLAAALPV